MICWLFWVSATDQIHRDKQSTGGEDGQVEPRVPEAQRSGRNKQHEHQDQHQKDKAQNRFQDQAAHFFFFVSTSQFYLISFSDQILKFFISLVLTGSW